MSEIHGNSFFEFWNRILKFFGLSNFEDKENQT
jgi:hypothetical protein